MYQRILVPLDGSAASDRGLREAIGLAHELKSHLLLHGRASSDAELSARHSPVPVLLVRESAP